jgi:hypothetical protein
VRLAIVTALVMSTAVAPRAAAALGRPRGRVEALACAPSNPDVAAAIVGGVVWVTRDGGVTWRSARRLDPLFAPTPEETADAAATEDVAEAPAEADASATKELVLAVGDRGEWAAAAAGRWVAEFGGGITVHAERGLAVSGLAFDAGARLWIAAGDRLVVVEDGRAVQVVVNAGSGAPAPLGGSGSVLVPGALGIAEIAVGAGGDVATRIAGPVAEAVGVDAIDGAVYAVRHGAISRVGDGGKTAFVARAPVHASRLVISGGAFWVLADGRWHTSATSGGPRPIPARAIAADARGRLWLGADQGPIAPQEPSSAVPAIAASRAPEVTIEFARRPPPPCPRPAAALLPDLALSFGFGLGEVASSTIDAAADTAGTRSWLAAGLTVTWALAPAVDGSCAARRERYAEDECDRLARHVELRAELARAIAAKAAARTIEDALSAANAVDAIVAQIAVTGGRAPNDKEQRK